MARITSVPQSLAVAWTYVTFFLALDWVNRTCPALPGECRTTSRAPATISLEIGNLILQLHVPCACSRCCWLLLTPV